MKLLQIYNQYRSLFGGEETVVLRIAGLVEDHGGEARLWMRSSRGLDESIGPKVRAAVSGIYNPFAYREAVHRIRVDRPDLAHVHNLYPLFSPSVLVALRRAGVPVVMTVHNHFHTCPTADHLYRGRICEKCLGGREHNCVLQNCRGRILESAAYTARSAIARKLRLFRANVTLVVALNEFARHRLVLAGFSPERVVVLPNMVEMVESPTDASRGSYAMFAGRMCPEKGVATLLEASRMVPEIPVVLVGDGPTFEEHRRAAPPSVTFRGRLPREAVRAVYRAARFVVVPSTWFEGCPLVISEAMAHGLPVIASRIGGLPELVGDGVNGLLFEPGDPGKLAEAMLALWQAPELCQRMGDAGRRRAELEFGERVYWDRLQAVYDAATALGPGGPIARRLSSAPA